MKREKIACSCHNVSYGKIIDAVHAGADVQSISVLLPAGHEAVPGGLSAVIRAAGCVLRTGKACGRGEEPCPHAFLSAETWREKSE